ncbi:nitroreductase/quinone reductase family protein [Georgenia sp. SYP-B2076]|uniref:nitroreductase/quinone reductase family protein n=1 Tax=Georgenia sp. SYP-B2076 TaxID=2495881 RepID=UPI0013DFC5F5|nr:nitroreductase/quinone reductase family protein [Georgenia sp. SYP-B2076]
MDPTSGEYPVVIVTHRGRRTGAIRKSPLIRVVHDDTYVLVGSFGGAPRDPLWVDNLRAAPRIRLRDRDLVIDAVATLLEGADRAPVWETAVRTFLPFASYQTRTTRELPVFRCTRS